MSIYKAYSVPKHHPDRLKGNLRKGYDSNSKPVRCIQTGKMYLSEREAERETGIGQQSISKACTGYHKTAGGYHWEFVEDTISLMMLNLRANGKV